MGGDTVIAKCVKRALSRRCLSFFTYTPISIEVALVKHDA